MTVCANARGLTLVEVVIALMVLSVGLLGLVSTSAVVNRMIATGRRYSEAAALVTETMEALQGGRCSELGNGGAGRHGISVKWRVHQGTGAGVRAPELWVTVEAPSLPGAGSIPPFYTRLYCTP